MSQSSEKPMTLEQIQERAMEKAAQQVRWERAVLAIKYMVHGGRQQSVKQRLLGSTMLTAR